MLSLIFISFWWVRRLFSKRLRVLPRCFCTRTVNNIKTTMTAAITPPIIQRVTSQIIYPHTDKENWKCLLTEINPRISYSQTHSCICSYFGSVGAGLPSTSSYILINRWSIPILMTIVSYFPIFDLILSKRSGLPGQWCSLRYYRSIILFVVVVSYIILANFSWKIGSHFGM